MNPTAAEMLKFVPVSFRAQTPPIAAVTTPAMTRSASFIELNMV